MQIKTLKNIHIFVLLLTLSLGLFAQNETTGPVTITLDKDSPAATQPAIDVKADEAEEIIVAKEEPSIIAPLSDAQRMQLSTANDARESIEESAFYALLENLQQWQGKEHEGFWPSKKTFKTMRTKPETMRGKVYVLEGRLEAIDHPTAKRELPPRIERWILTVDRGEEDFIDREHIIIYVVDPPNINTTERKLQPKEGYKPRNMPNVFPRNKNLQVRIVGRFYKSITTTTEKEHNRTFPIFVAQQAEIVSTVKTPGGKSRMAYVGGFLIFIVFGFVMFAFVIKRRMRTQQRVGNLRAAIIELRRLRGELDDEQETVYEYDEPENLSKNPDEALDTLSQAHKKLSSIEDALSKMAEEEERAAKEAADAAAKADAELSEDKPKKD